MIASLVSGTQDDSPVQLQQQKGGGKKGKKKKQFDDEDM